MPSVLLCGTLSAIESKNTTMTINISLRKVSANVKGTDSFYINWLSVAYLDTIQLLVRSISSIIHVVKKPSDCHMQLKSQCVCLRDVLE
jgi:hypothetical protein